MRKSKSFQQKPTHLSRRKFLRLAGLAAGGVLLNACQPVATPISGLTPTGSPTVTPSLSPTMSPTPLPTTTLAPTATATPTSVRSPTPSLTPTETSTQSPTATYTPEAKRESQNTREAADRIGFNLGVLVGLYPGSPDFRKLQEIQSTHFNLAALNVNWGNLEPNRGDLDFEKSGVDWVVNFAQKNKMKPFGLSLVWAADAPNWLKNGIFSREELIQIMTDHVKAVVFTYKGVDTWVVVNEPYYPPYREDDVFHRVIGSDYIQIAFKAAREANPSATLIYNDTFNHTLDGLTTQLTKQIVDELKPQGLIDAVGLQMHLEGKNPPKKEDVITTMREYGLPIHVTEFDVNMDGVPGTQEERYNIQAKIYREMLEAAIESGVCNHFTQ